MQVSVETLNGLERKVTVLVPKEKVEEKVKERLKELTRKVKIDGFRPGKASFRLVAERYADSVRHEVANDMLPDTLSEALKEHALTPAGYPDIEVIDLKQGVDFKYVATFEVLPTFEIAEINKAPVELLQSEVTDKNVDNMLEKLRKQHIVWHDASTPAEKEDKVIIDFEGFLDGKPFPGGKSEDFELILGSDSMIPGFEAGIIGKTQDAPFEINVTFPKEYAQADLAGKDVTFTMTIKKIMKPELPVLNDAFAKLFNIAEGGMDALAKDIKANMTRELERRINVLNREILFSKLLEFNTIDLPSKLIEREIENLKHDAYHRIFGHEHHDNEKIPDFPRALFEEEAKHRVHLGLLFAAYVKKHQIIAEKDKINAALHNLSLSYESPDEMRNVFLTNKDHMHEIENIVLEEMVAEKIAKDATVKYVKKEFDEIMSTQKNTDKGE